MTQSNRFTRLIEYLNNNHSTARPVLLGMDFIIILILATDPYAGLLGCPPTWILWSHQDGKQVIYNW